jgi:hypothetical protein
MTFPAAPDIPVVGLIELGPARTDVVLLESFRSAIILVGTGEACHIRVEHEHVSSRQFGLCRLSTSWLIASCPGAKNTTTVSGIPLRSDRELPLPAGAVIRVGHAGWVTVGADHQPGRWCIAAQSLDEFYAAALFAYGTARKAAKAIGMDQRTYLRAIHKIPEADAFLRRKAADKNPDKKYRPPFGVPIIPVSRDDS